jgi:hypothetical protein
MKKMRWRWDGELTRCSEQSRTTSPGWTPQLRDRKIDQLASVIAAMNTGQGPDLLGVCEVENRFVVDRLVDRVNATLPAARSYAVVHAETGDARGIDVASSTTTPCSRSPACRGGGLLPRGDASPSDPRDRAGQFQNNNGGRGHVGRLRQPLAEPQWRSVRVCGIPCHCRGDAQLFSPAGPRGARTPNTDVGDGDVNDELFDTSLVRHALSTWQPAKVTSAREEPLLRNLV